MPKVIHYKHPKFSDRYHACGMGEPDAKYITTELGKVTCKRCLGTVTADKLPRGRPPSPDSMTKKGKAWSMPDEAWDWLERQPNQSETIREAIALYRQQQA